MSIFPAGRRATALFTVVLLLVGATAASAFRPSTTWLLDQAAQKQLKREVRTLRVTQETTLYGLQSAPRGLSVPQRTWVLAPFSWREELEFDNGPEVRIRTTKQEVLLRPGEKPKTKKPEADLVADFLGGGAPLERKEIAERLMLDLGQLKIDTGVVSFARFDGRVAYLIGSKPWESDKPQVWVDKDTLQLLRVVTFEKRGTIEERREVRLLGYGSAEGGSWFPKTVEWWVGDRMLRRSVTRGVEKNEALERSLFEAP
jgi:hypothetical protein